MSKEGVSVEKQVKLQDHTVEERIKGGWNLTAMCLLSDFVGCREQTQRQLQAVVKPVRQGQGMMLRAAGTPALC